jgi:hypothetical protein
MTRNEITVSGGTFTNANFGIGKVTQNNHGTGGTSMTVADLRTALEEKGERIVALGRTEQERGALRHEIAATTRELAADEPDGPAVRFRWKAVTTILGAALAVNADVAQISQFVIDLFS